MFNCSTITGENYDFVVMARNFESHQSKDHCETSVLEGQLIHCPPKHPNFVTTQSRLKTYPFNWSTVNCPVPASDLADAGFFYSGPVVSHLKCGKLTVFHDVVTCFHCGHKIFDWKPSDNPWEEHKRLNSSCYFVQLNYQKQQSATSAACNVQSHPSQVTYEHKEEDEQSSSKVKVNKIEDRLSEFSASKDDANIVCDEKLKSNVQKPSENSKNMCKVCYLNEIEMLFLPCKHASGCSKCAASIKICPLCQGPITGSIRIFLS